jgi:hypothetical protein
MNYLKKLAKTIIGHIKCGCSVALLAVTFGVCFAQNVLAQNPGSITLSPGSSMDDDAQALSGGLTDTLAWGRKVLIWIFLFLAAIGIAIFFYRRSKRSG